MKTKTRRITILCSDAQDRAIRQAASLAGQKLGEYLLRAAGVAPAPCRDVTRAEIEAACAAVNTPANIGPLPLELVSEYDGAAELS